MIALNQRFSFQEKLLSTFINLTFFYITLECRALETIFFLLHLLLRHKACKRIKSLAKKNYVNGGWCLKKRSYLYTLWLILTTDTITAFSHRQLLHSLVFSFQSFRCFRNFYFLSHVVQCIKSFIEGLTKNVLYILNDE